MNEVFDQEEKQESFKESEYTDLGFSQEIARKSFTSKVGNILLSEPVALSVIVKYLSGKQRKDEIGAFLMNLQAHLSHKRKDLCDFRDHKGWTLLHHAAIRKNTYPDAPLLARCIIEAAPKILYSIDKYGNTALMVAAAHGDVALVKELLKLADTGVYNFAIIQNTCKWSALSFAAKQGSAKCIASILQAAGDQASNWILAQDPKGRTALHIAAENGRVDAAKKLISAAGKSAYCLVSMPNNKGQTASKLATNAKIIESCVDIEDQQEKADREEWFVEFFSYLSMNSCFPS